MGVKPRKEQVEREYKWGDIPTVEVPNLIGMKERFTDATRRFEA